MQRLPPSALPRWMASGLLGTALLASAHASEPLQVVLDDAWASSAGYSFSGRLTEARSPAKAGKGSSQTLYRTTRLLLTSGEMAAVRWSVGETRWASRADEQGYWSVQTSQPLNFQPGWYSIQTEPAASEGGALAGLLVHDPRNTWGLISDIDDTIMVSEVLKKRSLIRNSLTLPPESRQAVPGVAALYTDWIQRNPNPQATPVFYVSATPRQLTDSTRRFLQHNAFPRGIVQLKEVFSSAADPLTDQQAYKVKRITAIFQAFPGVRFTLVGDDGERDPESYAELQNKFPDRVEEIWIRRIHPDLQRAQFPGQKALLPPVTNRP